MTPSRDKLLVIDDDRAFGAIMTVVAKQKGFEPHYFTSLIEMGSFARIRDFDLAIIDYYLGSLRGDEIAEYVDTFFRDIPVMIVSSQEFQNEQIEEWPASVRKFVSKMEGPDAIIETARGILKRERLLRRLERRAESSADAP
jgi:DNA-binding response OmpR family regulator